jgi:hypothetical protein
MRLYGPAWAPPCEWRMGNKAPSAAGAKWPEAGDRARTFGDEGDGRKSLSAGALEPLLG